MVVVVTNGVILCLILTVIEFDSDAQIQVFTDIVIKPIKIWHGFLLADKYLEETGQKSYTAWELDRMANNHC